MQRIIQLAVLFWVALFSVGCAPKVSLFGGPEPLQESVLQGEGENKMLLIHIRGMIDNKPERSFLSTRPGMVQRVVARLQAARRDSSIKALLLVVDTPGGDVTASDVVYHEIMRYQQETGVKVVTLMMGLATSGGYYVSAPSDAIVAHPSTITGSIGTIFIRPQISELMEKIGVDAVVTKSGRLKDMGSPFRKNRKEEQVLFQEVIDSMNARFQHLVQTHRKLTAKQAKLVGDARILTAEQAKAAGLVDTIGYFDDAVSIGERLTDSNNLQVVVYRSAAVPNDTAYNTVGAQQGGAVPLISLGIERYFASLQTGFYYLWAPEMIN